MARRRKSAKALKKAARAVAHVRGNPGTMDLVKTIAPGAGTFLITTVLGSKAEALAGGQGITGKPPPAHEASPLQKIVSVAFPIAMGGIAWYATQGRLRPYRVSALTGVGAALVLRVVGHVMAITRPTQQMAPSPTGEVADYMASTTWSDDEPPVEDFPRSNAFPDLGIFDDAEI